MLVEMQCRDCEAIEERPFARPHSLAEDHRFAESRGHRTRCEKCGGVMDPTGKGLDTLRDKTPGG